VLRERVEDRLGRGRGPVVEREREPRLGQVFAAADEYGSSPSSSMITAVATWREAYVVATFRGVKQLLE
jgi:hypothetical protein